MNRIEAEEVHRGPRGAPGKSNRRIPLIAHLLEHTQKALALGTQRGRETIGLASSYVQKETLMSPLDRHRERKKVGAKTCRGPETVTRVSPTLLGPDSFVPGTSCLPWVPGEQQSLPAIS